MVNKYIYKSAIELAQLINDQSASSEDVVKEHLERIRQHNAKLNAVVIDFEADALKIAAQCDAETQRGESRGPLHGVPMTVKEQYWIKDVKSTLNFRLLKNWVAPEDAVIIKRLKDAGAIILGKTNVPTNLVDCQVSGDIYPEGKNPYNLDYTPGGSSGGAAAALASGMTPIELGSDFGGSIRNPSNYCGLYGMKPTEDTVPLHGAMPKLKNVRSFVFHMAQAGPMARTPEDLELVWSIIRGPHASDRKTARIKWGDASEKPLSEYKVAWVDRWPAYNTSDQTKLVMYQLIEQLNFNNCCTECPVPKEDLHERSLSISVRLFAQLISQDVPWFIKPMVKMQLKNNLFKGVSKFNRELNGGFKNSFKYYSETMGLRARLVNEWEKYFDTVDLLICPMGFGPAFKRCKTGSPILSGTARVPYLDYSWSFTGCFNASGHPAMNIPLGIGENGLPVGVQILGRYWSEPVLIQFAKLVATFTEGFVKPEGF